MTVGTTEQCGSQGSFFRVWNCSPTLSWPVGHLHISSPWLLCDHINASQDLDDKCHGDHYSCLSPDRNPLVASFWLEDTNQIHWYRIQDLECEVRAKPGSVVCHVPKPMLFCTLYCLSFTPLKVIKWKIYLNFVSYKNYFHDHSNALYCNFIVQNVAWNKWTWVKIWYLL